MARSKKEDGSEQGEGNGAEIETAQTPVPEPKPEPTIVEKANVENLLAEEKQALTKVFASIDNNRRITGEEKEKRKSLSSALIRINRGK
jgi:hypothetical protein